ncbi:MAG TPA: prepilin-type N-terminal cleavage/methylation domain-containing protein [Longimicrobiaceae bacterium]|nr:prepilin-type N-terminal cleavage/methylation domain-containing protein [Longimicrobiaceae bacterium]
MTSSRAPLRDRRGYTLLELMTVVLLLGILAALAAPRLSRAVQDSRTGGALNRLVSEIAVARQLAVTEGGRTRLTLSAPASYTLSRVDASGSETVVRTANLQADYPGVAFDLSGGAVALEFSSRGLVTNLADDQFIRIYDGDSRDSILVSAAGRVYRPR